MKQRLQQLGGRAVGRLPRAVCVILAGGTPVYIDGQVLDPHLQLVLALERRVLRTPPLDGRTPAEARARESRDARAAAGPLTPVGGVRDLTITGPAGALRARHYRPTAAGASRPLLVYLHGGGFVTCDLDTHDQPCRLLCRYAGVHVLSVEYRLAPEHPFPAAVDDATAALRWAREHAVELGADPDCIAIGGDSAGGNLATVACQLAVSDGDPLPAAQLLLYPTVDRTGAHASMRAFGEGFFLTSDNVDWYTAQYTGASGADLADPRISPLRAASLRGLPPAIVVTAGFDPLRDEGEAYATALRDAGVRTQVRRFPGLIHGFMNMTGLSPAVRDATVEVAGLLRGLLERSA